MADAIGLSRLWKCSGKAFLKEDLSDLMANERVARVFALTCYVASLVEEVMNHCSSRGRCLYSRSTMHIRRGAVQYFYLSHCVAVCIVTPI